MMQACNGMKICTLYTLYNLLFEGFNVETVEMDGATVTSWDMGGRCPLVRMDFNCWCAACPIHT